MQTISQKRALKSGLSRCYNHDPAHFSFYRQTPANQRNVPFERPRQGITTRGFFAVLLVVELIALAAVALV
jgi:hypothetical protein